MTDKSCMQDQGFVPSKTAHDPGTRKPLSFGRGVRPLVDVSLGHALVL